MRRCRRTTDQQFWLVVHEMFGTNDPGNWFPWGQSVNWTIIIVIVLVVRASKLGKAVTDLLAAIAELG